ncbi:hypothetical protein OWM54_24840 [Myxococcus sp. MISCRS1]|uniref:hypothetical protein n=1 Tax=Myxococcus TaxID=32 RepID=UPI0011423C2F|nr:MULTISPECIES: hypothetical protein [Myxococcus]MBZ4411719.1 hypothetical protein [Myxococcus sp. XM-1-1-1]MCK8500843.1 hypothetical protein [Myxococcus fulvus]MCY1000374.1 hypothetical protein [Myxococcus sp. MISCRS1]
MSFLWFTLKAYLFDVLYSYAVGLCFVAFALAASARSRKAARGHDGDAATSEAARRTENVVITSVLFILCSVQGLILAGAVKASLETRPEAWWLLWYVVGFGAALPAGLSAVQRDKDNATSQSLCYLGAAGSYLAACMWTDLIPAMLLKVSRLLAV